MAELLVEARALARTYRAGGELVVAVEHADCAVPPGARIALEGRSGSGKSTLLQMLGGIETPTRGTIAWPALGRRETLRPRHVAFVFQRESLVEALSVVENVALPLLIAGSAAADARRYALEALERFELLELADKLPEEISGGQSQRAAFARAVAQRPRLILADEPTGQLDTATAERFFSVLLPLLEPDGTALVVATHDARLAARMPTRWRMERGRLEPAP
jgi:putative ABC transport system ATP-binding protein/lipoprotein-releasing system ATP-binding protein